MKKEKALSVLQDIIFILSVAATAVAGRGLWSSFLKDNNSLFYMFASIAAVIAAYTAYYAVKDKKNKAFFLLSPLASVLCFSVITVIKALSHKITEKNIDAVCVCAVLFAFITPWVIVGVKRNKNKKIEAFAAVCLVLSFAVTVSPFAYGLVSQGYYYTYDKTATNPVEVKYQENQETELVNDADFYVSPYGGSDSNPGTLEKPFRTLEGAKKAVRSVNRQDKDKITVALLKGTYRVVGLEFTSEDSGTENCPVTYCAYGDGTVILRNNFSISGTLFEHVTDESVLERLNDEVKTEVLCCDLKKTPITKDDIPSLVATGEKNAELYEGNSTSIVPYELYVGTQRQTLARYPNDGFVQVKNIVSQGQEANNSSSELTSDVFKLSEEVLKRVMSWQSTDNVWMNGYWNNSISQASTPIKSFDAEKNEIASLYASNYGVSEGADFYFYNVLEELDTPGEWFYDEKDFKLYYYPTEENKDKIVYLSQSQEPVFSVNNAEYINFCNMHITGSLTDAVIINGNNITVSGCNVFNAGGNAITVNGKNNTISDCVISRPGKGGVVLAGGDTETLTPANNTVKNCRIYEWGKVYLNDQTAVSLNGVGNSCSNNNIYKSEGPAVTFSGNNHSVDHNRIYNVCQNMQSGGAVFASSHIEWYGNKIEYNCFYKIGKSKSNVSAVSLKNYVSGATVFGNILFNIPGSGLHFEGGRNLVVKNNIIINSTFDPIYYDAPFYEKLEKYESIFSDEENLILQSLASSPYKNEIWRKAYPDLYKVTSDYSKKAESDFVFNPSDSIIEENVIINISKDIGTISENVSRFSTFQNNLFYGMTGLNRIFVSPSDGDYSMKENSIIYNSIPEFKTININEIGKQQ